MKSVICHWSVDIKEKIADKLFVYFAPTNLNTIVFVCLFFNLFLFLCILIIFLPFFVHLFSIILVFIFLLFDRGTFNFFHFRRMIVTVLIFFHFGSLIVFDDKLDKIVFFKFLILASFLLFMNQTFVSVFDHMLIFFALKWLYNLRPFFPFLEDLCQEDEILTALPLSLGLIGVEMVQPPFSTLLGIPEELFLAENKELLGDIAPLELFRILFSK